MLDAYRWSMLLVGRILTRTVEEGAGACWVCQKGANPKMGCFPLGFFHLISPFYCLCVRVRVLRVPFLDAWF